MLKSVLCSAVVVVSSVVGASPLAAAPGVQSPLHREFRSTVSVKATDRLGYEPSLYRGLFFRESQSRLRLCILRRESHSNYRARNRVESSAMGAYQFLDNKWRLSLVYMMVAESRRTGDGLKRVAWGLRLVPIARWDRYWQDRAFFTALNYRGTGAGRSHWNYPASPC